MKFSKNMHNKQGSAIIWGVAIAIVAILIAIAVVAVIAAQHVDTSNTAPTKDGDEEAKIIGYIDVSATVNLDNGNLFGGYYRSVDGLKAKFVSGSNNNLDIFGDVADIWSHDEHLTVMFIVSTDYSSTQLTDEVSFSLSVGGGGHNSKTVSPDSTFYIRYNGTYVITAILLEDDGTEVDRVTTTLTV